MKIRSKLLAGFLPVAVLSALAMTWFTHQTVEQTLILEVVKNGRGLCLDLARNHDVGRGLGEGNEKKLLPLLQQVLENGGALYAVAIDSTGEVVAHTNVTERGRRYGDDGSANDAHHHTVLEIDSRRIVEVTSPVRAVGLATSGEEYLLLGQQQTEPGRHLGQVRIGLSLDEVLDTADQISQQVFWVITGVSGVSVILLLFYSGLQLRPIRQLHQATERIALGELGMVVDVQSQDEIGDLARSFNRMSGDLAATTVSKDFLDSVLDSMQDLLVVTNADWTIRMVNSSVQDLSDYGEDELLGLPLEVLLRDSGDQAPLTQIGSLTSFSTLETTLCKSGGGRVPVLMNAAAFGNDGGAGHIITAIDISERIESEEQMRKSLAEKEVLLKEIHHRVKNNLQIISSLLALQQGKIQDPQASEVFNASQSRIMTMALVHEKLYQAEDLSLVEFSEYVESLSGYLSQSYSLAEQQIALRAEIDDAYLRIDEAIPCGLIVNELIVNAAKHAFPHNRGGEIVIGFRTSPDGNSTLSVRDDGIGLPADFDIAKAQSLGLRMIKVLVQQLRGQLHIVRDEGTEFRIEFAAKSE